MSNADSHRGILWGLYLLAGALMIVLALLNHWLGAQLEDNANVDRRIFGPDEASTEAQWVIILPSDDGLADSRLPDTSRLEASEHQLPVRVLRFGAKALPGTADSSVGNPEAIAAKYGYSELPLFFLLDGSGHLARVGLGFPEFASRPIPDE